MRRARGFCVPILVGAVFAASTAGLAASARGEVEQAARAAIAGKCERCHPPLPDGGWSIMTRRPHDRAELSFLLHRMSEEYSAFLTEAERAAVIDFLARPD